MFHTSYPRVLLLLALLVVCLSVRPALAGDGWLDVDSDDPARLTVGLGRIGDIVQDRNSATLFSAEYRAGPSLELFYVRPSLGLIVTNDRSLYGYFCLSGDILIGDHLVLTPQAAVGGYNEGDGQPLGGIVQFKTGASLAWQFHNGSRLGVSFHHISNAALKDFNPGTELITAFYSHPLAF